MLEPWGWAGSAQSFLETTRERWLRALELHHGRILGIDPSTTQRDAWLATHEAVASALRAVVAPRPEVRGWHLVFEYELPLEGGRRPDLVVLAGPVVSVIEFKSSEAWRQPDIEQVATYAADLADFHHETHHRHLYPILVAGRGARADARLVGRFRVVVTGPGDVAHYLEDVAVQAEDRARHGEPAIDPEAWLAADYAPIPMLVTAARRYFEDNPLPHIKHHLAERLEETVRYLHELCSGARDAGGRIMAFVTGVPGSGKTLVGIRLVYEQRDAASPAVFLSGNGPLVQVLRDALGGRTGRVFVRDLHDVVKAIAKGKRAPSEVLVFDEAQRAWDRERMKGDRKRPIDASEPDLLVRGAEKLNWSVLVGLVGEGQEIHLGEEAGMTQWAAAMEAPNATAEWTVHCAPKLREVFRQQRVVESKWLDLDASIRSKRAEDLHRWVALLVDGHIEGAARFAARIHDSGFPLWLTRDLAEGRGYLNARYPLEDRDARFGLLCTSAAWRCHAKYELNSRWWRLNKELRIADWFNSSRDDPRSCCALAQPVTEFECQGLELSTAIVCWADDLRWDQGDWLITPRRRKTPPRDAEQLTRNAYRVILTRSRDGMVVWVPPEPALDETARTLLAAGMRFIPRALDLEEAS